MKEANKIAMCFWSQMILTIVIAFLCLVTSEFVIEYYFSDSIIAFALTMGLVFTITLFVVFMVEYMDKCQKYEEAV